MKAHDRKTVFSSSASNWETPFSLFNALQLERLFDLDAAATRENSLCGANYLGPHSALGADALAVSWASLPVRADGAKHVFCNPPYGRLIGDWTCKFSTEAAKGVTVFALLPVRTDTIWWQRDVAILADEVRFIPHRVHFLLKGKRLDAAPFPSAVVVWRAGPRLAPPRYLTWDYERRRP